jgi:hypothetical protein
LAIVPSIYIIFIGDARRALCLDLLAKPNQSIIFQLSFLVLALLQSKNARFFELFGQEEDSIKANWITKNKFNEAGFHIKPCFPLISDGSTPNHFILSFHEYIKLTNKS